MRKFYATIALCITLIGFFAPVAFSVSLVHENNTSAKSISVSTNTLVAHADETPPETAEVDPKNTECSFYDTFCHSFRLILTFVFFIPNSILVGLASLTDWSIHYSISSEAFRDINSPDSMVYIGWRITRDVANLGFIFALFVIAFSLILNRNLMQFDPKKAIVKVIVMALLINFSMLFCKLIIQTGDLFGNILYTRIDPPGEATVTVNGVENGSAGTLHDLGVRGVTLGIVNNINPQKLMQGTGANYNIETLQNWTGGIVKIKGWAYYVQMGTLMTYTSLINFVLLYLFINIAILFSSRIFGLWMLIIISPIAFVSYAIPSLEDNPYFGFKNWLDELVKLSFTAPIFLFFCYLVVSLLSHQSFGNIGNPNWGAFNATLMPIFAKLGATIYILFKGKKIAFEMAGRAGKLAQKIIDKTTGLALNAGLATATGGAAVVGRQVIGRAGVALAESGAVKGMMQGNSFAGKFLGKQISTAGKKVGAASFDIRDSKRFKGAMDSFNKSTGEKVNMGNMFQRKGGFEAEGGLRDLTNTARTSFEDYKIKQDKEIAELLKSGKGSKEQRDLRSLEADLLQIKQAAAAEESRIEYEAQESDPSLFITKKQDEKAKAELEKRNLENDKQAAATAKNIAETAISTAITAKTTLESNAAVLETKDSTLKTEKRQLEQARNNEADPAKKAALDDKVKNKQLEIDTNKDEKDKLAKEIKDKDTEIKTKEAEVKTKQSIIKNKDEAIKKKDEEIEKVNTYARILPDVANVRDAQQKKRDLEAQETGSIEKKEMIEAEEKMTKQDEKRKKLESDIEALGKKKANLTGAQLIQAEADIIQKNLELDTEQADYDAKKIKYDTKKATYNGKYGDQLMALRDFEADAVKIYKDQASVKARLDNAKESVLTAQLMVNHSQDTIDNMDHERISDYMNNVESNTSVFGAMGDHADVRSTDNLRRDYLNRKK